MEYDNTNRGVLFKNEKKEAETHSDYNGTINVDGVEYWLNAWLKESSKTGKKFFSLSVKPKESSQGSFTESAKGVQDDMEQSIPF